MARAILKDPLLSISSFRAMSSFRAVKLASARVGRAIKQRSNNEAQPKINDYNPARQFEPFPFAVTEENKIDVVRRVVTPLHDIPYKEQLSSKESFCRNALRLFGQELYKSGTPVRLDVKRLPCHVNPIVSSPQTTRYRNKDELSIWRGHDGKTITAGYMVFSIGKHGDTVCIEPNGCDTITEQSIKMTDIIQEFLRENAKLPICFSLGTDGGWRRFIIRTNLDGELMLVGVLSPRGLRVQQVLDEKENFRDFMMSRCRDVGLKLVSLYYQPCPHNKCRHQDVPFELLDGKPRIEEKIGKHKYAISPDSFMHQSSKGAEILYDVIRNTIDECFSFNKMGIKPLIIDAHCGVGVLAINLADMAGYVIGIDSCSQAIDDALTNAKLNGITNAEFICSNLEIVLERILEKYSKNRGEILVVCDAPKTGLHRNVVEVLRGCKDVNKMLFVTPKIDGPRVLANLLGLCGKGGVRSIPPFAPILATPVDIYPHVETFQTVIALERLPE